MVIVADNLVVDGVVTRVLRGGQVFAVCAVVQLIVQCATRGGACGDERLIAAFIDQIGDGGRRGGNGGSLLQRDADGDGVGSGVGVVLRFAVAVQIDFTDFDGDLDSADVVLRGQGLPLSAAYSPPALISKATVPCAPLTRPLRSSVLPPREMRAVSVMAGVWSAAMIFPVTVGWVSV